MAFYTFAETSMLGVTLRQGLNDLRDARYKLAHILGNLQQMDDATALAQIGLSSSAKAELQADIAKLLSDATGVNSAVVQMLDQFG